jgi:hypothetical protein
MFFDQAPQPRDLNWSQLHQDVVVSGLDCYNLCDCIGYNDYSKDSDVNLSVNVCRPPHPSGSETKHVAHGRRGPLGPRE